jgi:hypothetical protein
VVRILAVALLATGAGSAWAEQGDPEIERLRRDVEEMKRQMRQMQDLLQKQEETIRSLEAQDGAPDVQPRPATADAALDRALEEARAEPAAPPVAMPSEAIASRRLGPATLNLIDLSTDIIGAAGWSTANDDTLGGLQAGAHDPQRRGFTLQQAEFGFSGAVDPYFRGDAFVVFTDSSVELEEAFLTTTSLPYGFQLEAGHFFTEFGRLNPRHPHQWHWVDQPVIASRLLGPDGLRNPGVRLGWLVPLPWFSEVHVGMQDASGETAPSFFGEGGGGGDDHDGGSGDDVDGAGETTIGGYPSVDHDVRDASDLLSLARWENSWSWSLRAGSAAARWGISGLFGPNSTGKNQNTWIYGTDLKVSWRPTTNFRGWPYVFWETEAMKRDFDARGVRDATGVVTLPSQTLHDTGLYTQVLWGFRYPWSIGARYEYATGTGQSVGGRANDPLRDDRHRFSPLLVYQPTEFSRIRLQYNLDDAQHLDGDEHSVWTSVEILFGAHPAHDF